MRAETRDNDGKSETLALIKKVPQQRSHENERGKDIDVMFDWYRLCENINAQRIRSRPRRVMRQKAPIPSSATVAVQRHQVKCVWSKPRLNSGPRLLGQRTINVSQSTGGRVSNVFTRWDIFQMQNKVSCSRHFFYFFQLLIHQRTPTTAIFPGCSESRVVRPHIDSCVSDRREKRAQSVT